jgi:hypothetical protein
MQKLLLIFLATSLMVACKNNSNETTETKEAAVAADSGWATQHLKGMVKTIEESDYTPNDEGVIGEMDSCCVEVSEFNDKGYLIKYSEKDSQGNMDFETFYERNDDGKFVSYKRMKDGKQIAGRTTTYTEDGKILHAIDTDTAMQVYRIYNAVSENELGQPTSGKSLAGDSTFLGDWTFKYIDGMRAGRSWIDSSGTKLSDLTGELNDQGLLGKMTKVVMGPDGEMITKVSTYVYDTFDEMGNWTQATESEDGKVVQVEKRTYTYYE